MTLTTEPHLGVSSGEVLAPPRQTTLSRKCSKKQILFTGTLTQGLKFSVLGTDFSPEDFGVLVAMSNF